MLMDIEDMFQTKPRYIMTEGQCGEIDSTSYFSMALEMCKTGLSITQHRWLHEGLDDCVFVSLVKSIINWFIEGIKDLVERFIYAFNRFTDNKVYIEKHAQDILAFNKEINIPDFKHFRYTNLDANIPPAFLKSQFMDEYYMLMEKLKRIGREEDKEKLLKDLNAFYHNMMQNKEQMFYFRGLVLDQRDYAISAERFSEELFKVFRNGDTISTNHTIYPKDIEESFRRYKNKKVLTDCIKKQEKEIKENASEVKRRVKNIRLYDITDGRIKVDYDLEVPLNNILKWETSQLTSMCSITLMAYGAKMDAIKEAVESDKRILYACISEIIGA